VTDSSSPADAPLRLVLFDCDGTLIDSQAAIVAAMAAACTAHGVAVPGREAVRRVVGLPLDVAIAGLAPTADARMQARLVASYKEAFAAHRRAGRHPAPLFDGAAEALAAVEATGALLGIATGKSRRGLDATLDELGWCDRFVITKTADDGPGKPAPDMVLRAMAETGVEAATTAVVGDTTFDMMMARAARVPALGVGWGYHAPADLAAAGAVGVATAFADVPPALDRLWGAGAPAPAPEEPWPLSPSD
jgi:phosphoglycolate phosphatase